MESNSRGKSCVDSLNGENTVSDIDTEKFRLRRFVERLDSLGEVTTIKDSVDLTNLAAAMEANEKAVLFKQVGPDKLELVANVNSSRKRLAVAFETDEANVISEFQRRLDNPQPVVDVKQEDGMLKPGMMVEIFVDDGTAGDLWSWLR